MKLDIIWQGIEPDGQIRKTVVKAAKAAAKAEGMKGSVSLLLTEDESVRQLNSRYRSIDSTTDVLSFPSGEAGFLGDIAISVPRAQLQAAEFGHSLAREVAFLTVHGMLHLFGYDHIEMADEEKMRARQREILKNAGYEVHE